MKVCTCFLFFRIFALTNSLSRIKTKEDHRSVQQALENDSDYINEDTGDTKNLDDVNNFTTTVRDGKKNLQLVFKAPKVETFTDFIQETVDILNTYDDKAFEDFFYILDKEIRKYHYTGCKFSELMQNHNTRGLLAGVLQTIRENSVTFTKASINEIADILRVEVYDKNVKELLDYINSLYRNTETEFRRVLNNLNNYRKTKSMASHNDLVQIIRDGVRTILFDHYTELDTHTRRELKERIETFWENIKKICALNEEINYIPKTDPVGKSFSNNIKVTESITNKVKEHEHVSKSDLQSTFLDKRKIIGNNETYDEQSRDNETEKDERSFESGDVQLAAPARMDMTKEAILYPKAAKETKTLPTKTTIASPVMRAQEEIESKEPSALRKPTSKYSKRKESYFKKQPNELRRHGNTRVQNINENIIKKINTIENELIKLKEIHNLRIKMNNNLNDEVDVTNVTDDNETKVKDESLRKYMANVKKLLKNINDLNIDELLLQYLNRHDLKNYEDTYDIRSNTIKPTDSTVEVTNAIKFESVTTIPTAGITRRMGSSEPTEYNWIRHEDQIERLNKMFDVFKDLQGEI